MIFLHDFMAYFWLFSAAAVWIATRNLATSFVLLYLLAWEVMKWGLIEIGQYDGSLMPIFLGIVIDLLFIKIITSYDMTSNYVGPALLVSCFYGAGCLLEDWAGGYILCNMYGWSMAVLAGLIVTGGFYDDPRGGRMFYGNTWVNRLRGSLAPMDVARKEKAQ